MGEHLSLVGAACRRGLLTLCVFMLGLGPFSVLTAAPATAVFDPCAPGSSPVVCENSKPGTPASEWDIVGAGDPSIQGFATDMSVNVGGTIGFKVDTDASAYEIRIYRLGWYGGDGARHIDTIAPSAPLPQAQPSCLYDEDTGLIDCGNWGLSASWTVPDDAVSGVYVARLMRSASQDSHIVFVVRDDASTSDLLFQTSDPTWQAYNQYGGNSLYHGAPWGRALKVSYNRPLTVRYDTPDGRDSVFGAEYAMVRWLERNGYDVSYLSGVDTDRYGATLLGNHDVFLSVGHDEYWSAGQRTNVEAARDAGMHMAFLSGNEVFWRTRWEPSIDGSNTSYRTLVTYKETHENERVDPTGEWTGTWRDPRFVTPQDGIEPENSLTGSLFMVMCCTYSIKVPAGYGDLRFWRNTEVAALAAGQEAVLPWGTLGYEWNEDIDNGFRPAGAFRMSETTETVERRLIDHGTETEEAEATHHLMTYRASSGALVWGAGTTQWSWGLDDYHDGPDTETSDTMRQATVNMFADMGVQPATLQAGLVPATVSTDTAAPAVTITSPTTGASVERGGGVTVAGTATDSGGGVVAGVEVSLDGGTTWRRADGRGEWAFEGGVSTIGPVTIQARAVDDSGNLGEAAAVDVDVTCPCQIFANDAVPAVAAFNDPVALELGVKFQTEIDGWIEAVRFYKGPGNTGTHVGSLWTASGELLGRATFTGETASGWQQVRFAGPVPVTADTTYVASYHAPNGHYPGDTHWFRDAPTLSPPLRALQDGEDGLNGVYREGTSPGFPTSSFGSRNYWVDVVFNNVAGPDQWPPAVASTTPSDGAWGVGVGSSVSVRFNEPIEPDSLELTVSSEGTPIAGTVTYHDATRTARFDPEAALQPQTEYTATARAEDLLGNAMAEPHVFSFTTGLSSEGIVVLWDQSVVPGNISDSDNAALTLGVKFTSDVDGTVSGVRFYKGPSNTGTHIGSLWDANGILLAEATFANESPSGWQQVLFDQPVPIQAGVTYVASYHTPTGHFSADRNYFLTEHVSEPLRARASGSSGGNGVHAYGAAPTFPSGSSGHANYWVTPVFAFSSAPQVIATAPVGGTVDVGVGSPVAATFNEAIDPESVVITVAAGGEGVEGTISTSADGTVATFNPDGQLAHGTTYSVSITADDMAGNAMTEPVVFSFTTELSGDVMALWDLSATPVVINDSDVDPLTLGVKFTSSVNAAVRGVRFYKGPSNTGTHIGSLWNANGNMLAEATFTHESPSGWQQVLFDQPVPIQAGVTYVVSYHTPTGHFSADRNYFLTEHVSEPLRAPASGSSGGNGVYAYGAAPTFPSGTSGHANYWVTPLVDTTDAYAPGVTSTSPTNGARDVPLGAPVSIVFNETINPSSLTVSVQAADGATDVTVELSGNDTTVTLTPESGWWTPGAAHTVQVSATDPAGNPMAEPYVFSFRVAPATLWDGSAVPAVIDDSDVEALTLGVKFASDVDGVVTGVRFYKGLSNTGTHVGSMWDASGNLLAEATFTDESADGWQQVLFSTSVPIQAGTTYVASYHTPTGSFSADRHYFAAEYVKAPLRALASGPSGGNGVYAYGATSTFPTGVSGDANYWVTPVFRIVDDTVAPDVVSTSPAAGATDTSTNTTVMVVFSEPVDPQAAQVTLRTGSTTVPGSLAFSTSLLTATFTPHSPLASTTTYTLQVSSSDLAGNAMVSPYTFSFTTRDSVPPQVSSTTPANGASNVALNTAVSVTFNEAITLSSVTTTVTQDGSPVTVSSSLSANGRTLTITRTGGWTANRLVALQVRAADTAGNLMPAAHGFSFRTIVGDITPPQVSSTSPAAGASGVAPSAPVSVTFNEPVSAGSVSLVVRVGSSPVSGSVSYNAVSRTATFAPAAALGSLTTYSVSASATDTAGNAMASPYTFSFTTRDSVPPQVSSTTPANGASNVALNTAVSVTFNEAITLSSVTTTVTQDGSPVTVSSSLSANGRTLTITRTGGWTANRLVALQVRAADTAGNLMPAAHGFSFRTIVGDITPPQVSSTSPANGATGVALNTAVAVLFNEAITLPSVTLSVLQDGTAITVNTSLSSDGRTLTVTRTGGWTVNRGYTFQVRASDVAGNQMPAPHVFFFRTVTQAGDTTPPQVSSTSPANGAQNVGLNTQVTVTFSEAITLNSVTVSVLQDGTSVTVNRTLSANGRTLTLTRTGGWTRNRGYTFQVTASDVAGNQMPSPHVFFFRTIS